MTLFESMLYCYTIVDYTTIIKKNFKYKFKKDNIYNKSKNKIFNIHNEI